MKNYYLKRIDELRTEVGSDSRPNAVATISRFAAGATYPVLKQGAKLAKKAKQGLKLPFEDFKGDVKKALQKRLKAAKKRKNDPKRVERLKKSEEDRVERFKKPKEDAGFGGGIKTPTPKKNPMYNSKGKIGEEGDD